MARAEYEVCLPSQTMFLCGSHTDLIMMVYNICGHNTACSPIQKDVECEQCLIQEKGTPL